MAQIIAYIEYAITHAVAKLYLHGATRLRIETFYDTISSNFPSSGETNN